MPAFQDFSAIEQLPLFQGLPTAQLEQLNALLHRKRYPARTNLITVEQPGEVIYIIVEGTVKVHVEQADGSDVIIAFGGPGDVEGEMSLLGDGQRSATVVTQEETEVLWIARAGLQQ